MTTRFHRLVLALAASAAMAGCGGGGGDDSPPPLTEVPDAALVSPDAYIQFARSLGPDDSAEPLALGRLDVAPTSETEEPVSLDRP
ncbi:MAG TPA: hypothetical protein VGD46_09635 [Rhizobacter sp.]